MSVGITFEEMLAWNNQASDYWKAHLEANPDLLDLPCGIGGAKNVQEFVRHIWGAELRWAQRLAALPETPRDQIPARRALRSASPGSRNLPQPARGS